MARIDIATAARRQGSGYPEPFCQTAPSRNRIMLGDGAGLTQFGVNLTTLPPGEWSSMRHWHPEEDEFVYVLQGTLTLIEDVGEVVLHAGECAGFAKGVADGHHLINRSDAPAVYLEIGTRTAGDDCHYPDVDLFFDGTRGRYTRKDGTPYPKP